MPITRQQSSNAFDKSNQILHSPKIIKMFNCKLCKEADNEKMIKCNKCNECCHQNCVGVDYTAANWICPTCSLIAWQNPATLAKPGSSTTRRNLEQHSSLHPFDFPKPIIEVDKKSSKATSYNKSYASSKRRQLAMQKLEEERLMHEENDKREQEFLDKKAKRNQEFLEKKYALLNEESEDENELMSNHDSRTNEWVKTQQNDNEIVAQPMQNFQSELAPPQVSNIETSLSPAFNLLQLHNRNNTAFQPMQPHTQFVPQMNPFTQPIDQNATRQNNLLNQQRFQLTNEQIAARHSTPKDLPTFAGNPEEWPIFYCSYIGTTQTCNFSNYENLLRLQRSLKGKALEAVRYRLLLPESVPGVIETLRIMFGRPELIIHNLLNKIRNEPAPKPDRLDTLVSFALSVQNLCSTMEGSGLTAHLNNPTLLLELTQKLPPTIKLSWAMHKQTITDVTLSSLSNWLFEIAVAANELVYPIENTNVCFSNNNVLKSRELRNSRVYFHESTDKNVKLKKNTKSTQNCFACEGFHVIIDCPVFRKFNHSQRWNLVRDKSLCGKCLKAHSYRECTSKVECKKNGCKKKHHQLLHNDQIESNHNTETKNTEQTNHMCHHKDKSSLFRIVPVKLYGQTDVINTYAFLDEGSSLTMIEEDLANKLKLKGTPHPLCLKWTADVVRKEPSSQQVTVLISGSFNKAKKYKLVGARTVTKLSLPKQSLNINELRKYPHLRNVPFEGYHDIEPKILIGMDNIQLGIPQEVIEGKWEEPVATRSRLGWVIHGKSSESNEVFKFHHINVCECNKDNELHQLVKQYFSLDNAGISVPGNILESDEIKRAKQILGATTHYIGDSFETGLLWKYDEINFPASFSMAKNRMLCLEQKMRKEKDLALNLHQQIKDYVTKGYARKLSPEEAQRTTSRTWYLPIFSVKNANKPGKVRLVWDAAAKVNGISLNSALLKGPDQLTSLLAVLQRFRQHEIAICGDICEMFHQVKIKDKDQDSQRFLWRYDSRDEPQTYVMQVMTFGASCSPCSAQYVKNLNASKFKEKMPRAVQAIIENHYVDDLLDSVNTTEEAIKLAKEVKYIHSKGGFHIRNWISNSSKVTKALGEVKNNVVKNLNLSPEDTAEKVLGMFWCTDTDMFTYPLRHNKIAEQLLKKNFCPTKREILRTLMSVFDPLGLVANFLIYLKILLQDLWAKNVGWDDAVTEEIKERWYKWIDLLPEIKNVRIPRCHLPIGIKPEEAKIQLHIFVDASEKAYSAVAYFRITYANINHISIICAKTKVAPQKPLSIPRLELQAALLGSRLSETIHSTYSYNICETFMWSDSITVLSWLNSTHRNYKQFVALRLGEILEHTDIKQWNWVPTKMNVADEATKWTNVPTFEPFSRWNTGPEFLKQERTCWPKRKQVLTPPQEELRPNTLLINIHSHSVNIIDTTRFSKWRKLVNTLVYVQRFIYNLRANSRQLPKKINEISHTEYSEAENIIIKAHQGEQFVEEILTLKQNKDKKIGKNSPIYKLSPYLDDNNIIRVHGRIDQSTEATFESKRPIILNKDHHTTILLVKHYHEKYLHHNNETVVNEIRQKYHIPRLRVVLRKIISKCQLCKNAHAKPELPEMALLPPARLAAYSRPFSFVGIDYFGPLQVVVGRRTEKRWGVLFTCLTIRAIHLEITHSLDTSSCVMAIRNFIAKRGVPKEIRTDNGTNFVGASKKIASNVWKQNATKIQNHFTDCCINWIFNPPSAPHFGGSWERMVRSVKTTLYKIMPTRNLSDEVLRSLFAEIEIIVNSRPLTYVPIDADTESLTPNHFLLGSSNGIKPLSSFNDSAITLKNNWKITQYYANKFWQRWLREYLPTLTRRTKWFQPVKPIVVGDIVIVINENASRNEWLKGRILETKTDKNGQVRQATVQTVNGVMIRPAAKLAVLDIKQSK